jgi:hypothetical protein
MLATTSFLAGTEKTTYQIVHTFVQDQAQGYLDATHHLVRGL